MISLKYFQKSKGTLLLEIKFCLIINVDKNVALGFSTVDLLIMLNNSMRFK